MEIINQCKTGIGNEEIQQLELLSIESAKKCENARIQEIVRGIEKRKKDEYEEYHCARGWAEYGGEYGEPHERYWDE
jgi:hypothetical protein